MRVLIIILSVLLFSVTLYLIINSLFHGGSNGYPQFSDDDFTRLTKHVIPEAKDMGKTFLTLSTAVLVASITFSEKIIQFQTADRLSKTLIICSWMLILVSIIICGIGLSVLMFTEACIVFNSCDHTEPLIRTAVLLLSAGVTFALGLMFFILSAITSNNLSLKKSV